MQSINRVYRTSIIEENGILNQVDHPIHNPLIYNTFYTNLQNLKHFSASQFGFAGKGNQIWLKKSNSSFYYCYSVYRPI
jgi:hypothetical protein